MFAYHAVNLKCPLLSSMILHYAFQTLKSHLEGDLEQDLLLQVSYWGI